MFPAFSLDFNTNPPHDIASLRCYCLVLYIKNEERRKKYSLFVWKSTDGTCKYAMSRRCAVAYK